MSGSLSVYLISGERLRTGQSSGLIAAQMRVWFWLGLVASLVVAAVAPWF
jgi:hypothetical protein